LASLAGLRCRGFKLRDGGKNGAGAERIRLTSAILLRWARRTRGLGAHTRRQRHHGDMLALIGAMPESKKELVGFQVDQRLRL